MKFAFPDTELSNNCGIKLRKVLYQGGIMHFNIEGFEGNFKNRTYSYWIRYDTLTKRGHLMNCYSRPVNLENKLERLPEPIRDFILFNLDVFA
jgi:hypothetical protein